MISKGSSSTTPSSVSGTLGDYSEDLYRYFFEVSDRDGVAKGLLLTHLGAEGSAFLQDVENGYELDIPIQCAPELVRLLTDNNIAVYQVVRSAKSEGL